MGNRAVLAIQNDDRPSAIGIYLHWNGGRDSVEAFLLAARMMNMHGDESYGQARLAQVIGVFMGGNSSFGVDHVGRLDCDNHDNGLYLIDCKTMSITGRKYMYRSEQNEYDVNELAAYIVSLFDATDDARNDDCDYVYTIKKETGEA